ncbi:MAG: MBL fold metallo-hydrolase [Candidatus Aenigmarchaeota archaeon]|nr:MBL fold metallo-hydrolase [Candidatus Aenigmarchaeota archaeon]
MTAKLTFLGTGGGRFVTSRQIHATGGWILKMDNEMLHIDPGPGALVRAKQYKVDLSKLTGILVSHCHPDHYTDAKVVIEAMTQGTTKKKGVLLTNETIINGLEPEFVSFFSKYHLSALEKYKILKPKDKTNIGKIEITATKTIHGDPKGIGFIFKGSSTIGYTSDGEYFNGLGKQFSDCDYLILNLLRPRNSEWPKHMNSRDAVKILKEVKPKLAILQHFGFLMMNGIAEKEGKWIEKESGIKTIVAKDGQSVCSLF